MIEANQQIFQSHSAQTLGLVILRIFYEVQSKLDNLQYSDLLLLLAVCFFNKSKFPAIAFKEPAAVLLLLGYLHHLNSFCFIDYKANVATFHKTYSNIHHTQHPSPPNSQPHIQDQTNHHTSAIISQLAWSANRIDQFVLQAMNEWRDISIKFDVGVLN